MAWIQSCPVDGQQTEFFGIMHKRVPGREAPVHIRWMKCTSCPAFVAVSSRGTNIHVRMQGWDKDELRKLFPSTGEKKFGRQPKKVKDE